MGMNAWPLQKSVQKDQLRDCQAVRKLSRISDIMLAGSG